MIAMIGVPIASKDSLKTRGGVKIRGLWET